VKGAHQGRALASFRARQPLAEDRDRGDATLGRARRRAAAQLRELVGAQRAAGATLRVLDHEPEAERGAVLDVGNATVPAILAEVSGEGTREAPAGFAGDAGLFRTRWSLSLWFDERTGHILRSERWEVAESEIAGFEEHDVLWVTDAPYLPERAQSAALPTHDCALETTPRAPTFVRLGVPIGALSIMLAALVVARRRASEERR
jgi:hypothetical protein